VDTEGVPQPARASERAKAEIIRKRFFMEKTS
jgi:hypothetical protein